MTDDPSMQDDKPSTQTTAGATPTERVARSSGRRWPAVCSEPGCNRPVEARGLCARHYNRWRYISEKRESANAKAAD